MRKIKFRAWDKKHKTMCEVVNIQFITIDDPDSRIPTMKDLPPIKSKGIEVIRQEKDSPHATHYFLRNEDFELMQYTGLDDTNGVKIFESDICRMYYENDIPNELFPFYYEVVWGRIEDGENKESPGWYARDVKTSPESPEYECLNMWDVSIFDEDFEIVGNIYEHSHLLKSVVNYRCPK